eukprot:TRINITY_DN11081_c0_g1_i1.p2 TRINITY_DN11081_c0_g1~~TRINITY_DN11081_c0_g1_i1.p2  ORF type:complete len:196 (-),score=19.78 TRINITY_DN11081_c0_g1_i1:406-993(-)
MWQDLVLASNNLSQDVAASVLTMAYRTHSSDAVHAAVIKSGCFHSPSNAAGVAPVNDGVKCDTRERRLKQHSADEVLKVGVGKTDHAVFSTPTFNTSSALCCFKRRSRVSHLTPSFTGATPAALEGLWKQPDLMTAACTASLLCVLQAMVSTLAATSWLKLFEASTRSCHMVAQKGRSSCSSAVALWRQSAALQG